MAQVATHICLLQIEVKPVILEHPDSWSRMADGLELVVALEMPTSRLGMVVFRRFFS